VAQIGVHRDHEPLNHPFMKEKVRSVARKVTIADVSPAGVVLHFDSGVASTIRPNFYGGTEKCAATRYFQSCLRMNKAQVCANTPAQPLQRKILACLIQSY
jgi:hypothetical protein